MTDPHTAPRQGSTRTILADAMREGRWLILGLLLAGAAGLLWAGWPKLVGGPTPTLLDRISREERGQLGEIIWRVSNDPEVIEPDLRDQAATLLAAQGTLTPEEEATLMERFRLVSRTAQLFWHDAREASRKGEVVRGPERARLERRLGEEGFLSSRRLQANQAIMERIARHEPLTGFHGVEIILDEALIQRVIETWDPEEIEAAIQQLFPFRVRVAPPASLDSTARVS